METKTLISKRINTLTNNINKYAAVFYSQHYGYRLVSPEGVWAVQSSRPIYINQDDNDEESMQRVRYLWQELLERETKDYWGTFKRFVRKYKLQKYSLLAQLHNFFIYTRVKMKFKSPMYDEHDDTCTMNADIYAILRVILYILNCNEDKIVAYAEAQEDQEHAARQIDKFFVLIAREIALTNVFHSRYKEDFVISEEMDTRSGSYVIPEEFYSRLLTTNGYDYVPRDVFKGYLRKTKQAS